MTRLVARCVCCTEAGNRIEIIERTWSDTHIYLFHVKKWNINNTVGLDGLNAYSDKLLAAVHRRKLTKSFLL